MSETKKPFRGITDDLKNYYIDDSQWQIQDVGGLKLEQWREGLLKLSDNTASYLEKQTISKKLTVDILESGLKDFNYMKALEKWHPKELEGSAGELYAFLYELGTPRERELLMTRLTATQQS